MKTVRDAWAAFRPVDRWGWTRAGGVALAGVLSCVIRDWSAAWAYGVVALTLAFSLNLAEQHAAMWRRLAEDSLELTQDAQHRVSALMRVNARLAARLEEASRRG